jgi:hypothetical protein
MRGEFCRSNSEERDANDALESKDPNPILTSESEDNSESEDILKKHESSPVYYSLKKSLRMLKFLIKVTNFSFL